MFYRIPCLASNRLREFEILLSDLSCPFGKSESAKRSARKVWFRTLTERWIFSPAMSQFLWAQTLQIRVKKCMDSCICGFSIFFPGHNTVHNNPYFLSIKANNTNSNSVLTVCYTRCVIVRHALKPEIWWNSGTPQNMKLTQTTKNTTCYPLTVNHQLLTLILTLNWPC